MKKTVLLLILVLLVTLTLGGCGKKTNEPTVLETAKDYKQAMDVGQQLQQAQESGDQDDMAEAMQGLMDFGSDIEIREFEKIDSLGLPQGFPANLNYSNGKVVGATNNSDETYIDQSIEIKTTDEFKNVKDHYRDVLSKEPWQIKSESVQSNSASYSANQGSDDFEVEVYIQDNQYSKIVEIDVDYFGVKK